MHFKQRPGHTVCQGRGTGVIRANGAALWGLAGGRATAVSSARGIDNCKTSAHGCERNPL